MQLKGELKLSLRKFLKSVELAQKCFYKKNLVAKERNRRVPEDAYIVQTSLEFHVLYLIQNLQYLFEHQRKNRKINSWVNSCLLKGVIAIGRG